MRKFKYIIQFILIVLLFFIYRLIGLKLATFLSSLMFMYLGPLFKSKMVINNNLSIAFPNISNSKKTEIIKKMWSNYGKIFAEYIYIGKFRYGSFSKKIKVENQDILNKIKKDASPVIFVSGHFDNFELMAMHIEKSGINLSVIYRPLNNKFLNPLMEKIRKRFICKNQIEKGSSGTRKLLKQFKQGNSIALMIDQRVSEGISASFFSKKALTTTIPAQFVKKFKAKVVPIHIERVNGNNFNLKIHHPINFSEKETIESITLKLNQILEKMIIKNPDQWIWTHNRWK